MRNVMLHAHAPRLRVLLGAATLALTLAACGKEKGGTTTPGGDGAAAGPGAGAVTNPAQATAEAKEDFAKASEQFTAAASDGNVSKDECESVSKAYRKVYEAHGKQMAIAFFNSGVVLEQCGDTSGAEKVYVELTKAVPEYDLSYNNLGVLAWKRGDEVKAREYFEKAIKANPKTRAPRNNLAAALRQRYADKPSNDDFSRAEGEIQRVLAVDSSNRLAYENLARLYYDRGRLKDKSYLVLANLVVTQAVKILKDEGKESADIYNLQGLLFMQEQNQIDALRAFKRAAEVNKNHPDANMNIGLIAIRFRDYAAAETAFQTAMKTERFAKNPEAWLGLGVAQRGLRKYKEAETAFTKAQELAKSDPRPDYNLGILYQEHLAPSAEDFEAVGKKQYEKAKDYFAKFQQRAGTAPEFAPQVADAKERAGNIDDLFKNLAEMKKLEAEAAKLAELAKKQEEEERAALLKAEEEAIKAAEEAAKAEAAAAGGAK
jgi:Flp pilus assembly protein TadD